MHASPSDVMPAQPIQGAHTAFPNRIPSRRMRDALGPIYKPPHFLPSLRIPTASGRASGLEQPDTGLPINDDLKDSRATLPLGFLISSDKSFHRGRPYVHQVKVVGYPAKTPWVLVA